MLSITLTATLTLDCKTISTWFSFSFWSIALFILFYFFLTVKYFWMNNILKFNLKKKKKIQTLEMFFFILCISCMLMFCACFRNDRMRYCNIHTTIALDSCTSQLSINMVKEEMTPFFLLPSPVFLSNYCAHEWKEWPHLDKSGALTKIKRMILWTWNKLTRGNRFNFGINLVKCFCDETERQEVDTLDVYLVNLKLASDVSPPYSNHEKDKATEIAWN